MNAIVPHQHLTVAPRGEACGLNLLKKKPARALAVHEDRALVLAECHAVIEAAVPASLESFGMQVERLALHYPESRLTAQERAVVIRDWRRLMGHLPFDILAEAVDEYLMSPARFFPTPGQLDALANPMFKFRSLLAQRARDTLLAIGQQHS